MRISLCPFEAVSLTVLWVLTPQLVCSRAQPNALAIQQLELTRIAPAGQQLELTRIASAGQQLELTRIAPAG